MRKLPENIDLTLPTDTIVREYGVSRQRISYLRKKKGIVIEKRMPTKEHKTDDRNKYPYHLFNWELPDFILSNVWGVKFYGNIYRYRKLHKITDAVLDGRKTLDRDNLYRLICEESKKAAEYYGTYEDKD